MSVRTGWEFCSCHHLGRSWIKDQRLEWMKNKLDLKLQEKQAAGFCNILLNGGYSRPCTKGGYNAMATFLVAADSLYIHFYFNFYHSHFSTTATATKTRPNYQNNHSITASWPMTDGRCTQNPFFYWERSPNLICTAHHWSLLLPSFCFIDTF